MHLAGDLAALGGKTVPQKREEGVGLEECQRSGERARTWWAVFRVKALCGVQDLLTWGVRPRWCSAVRSSCRRAVPESHF